MSRFANNSANNNNNNNNNTMPTNQYRTTFFSLENLIHDYDKGEIWNRDDHPLLPKPDVDQHSSAFDHLFWNYPCGTLHGWVWQCIINCHRMLNDDLQGYISLNEINQYPKCKDYFCEVFGSWGNLPTYSVNYGRGNVRKTCVLSPHNYLRIILQKAAATVPENLDMESLNRAVLQQIEEIVNRALETQSRAVRIQEDWHSILTYKKQIMTIYELKPW